MHNGIFPFFTKGRVLKKESLEYLRDFPYDLASLAWDDYSDGVLFGFSVSFENRCVIVSKGALKHQGNIIIVPGNTGAITEHGRLLYIKLSVGRHIESEDYRVCPVELTVDRNAPDNEIELGRFCLNQGAVLRCEYDSFNDLRTPENTLDITNVCYAGMMAATLHPHILKEYARALLESSTDPVDIGFALMCLNAGVVHKNTIQWHIAKKIDAPYREYTVKELYEKLVEVLSQCDRKHKTERPRGKGPSIIG